MAAETYMHTPRTDTEQELILALPPAERLMRSLKFARCLEIELAMANESQRAAIHTATDLQYQIDGLQEGVNQHFPADAQTVEACARVCQDAGDAALARAENPRKYNPRDPLHYSQVQEGVFTAHYEDAAAIRALAPQKGGKK